MYTYVQQESKHDRWIEIASELEKDRQKIPCHPQRLPRQGWPRAPLRPPGYKMDSTEHRGITLEQLLDIVKFAVYSLIGGNVTGRTLGFIDADDLQACIGSIHHKNPGVCTISVYGSFSVAPNANGEPF